jgi:diguanylate cyclase (GGDEF)-like protein
MRLVKRQLVQSPRDHRGDAIAFIDLDHFKIVNDAGGHALGDVILKSVTDAIKRCIGANCALARLGGDEFGLLMPGHSLTAATTVGARICASVSELPIEVHGQRIRIGASVGLAKLDEDWDNAESAMQAVDVASYIAKHKGRGRIHIFTQDDQAIEALRDDMRWVREIEKAPDAACFELQWQEIRPLHPSQELIRLEILLRLIESDGTRVGPNEFMPAAERFHIASRIDRWVVTQTFEWFSARPDVLATVESISINLPGHSVADPQFLDFMVRSIHRAMIAAQKICLEITETAAIVDFEGAAAFIKTLRNIGVRFALDDFGSGMSSFAYLSRLDVDYIKIDGQFVRGLATNRFDQATVRYIQEIAGVTGRRTVAECVEDAATSRLLRDFGINYEQGFHCHRPEKLDGLVGRAQCRSRLQLSSPV